MLHKIDLDQKKIDFMWVSGHVGMQGNEPADRAAKNAFDKELTDELVPFSDLKKKQKNFDCQIYIYTSSLQKEWDEAVVVSSKLCETLQKLSDNLLSFERQENEDSFQFILYWSFLFDTRLYLKKEPPVCVECSTITTIKYILLELLI